LYKFLYILRIWLAHDLRSNIPENVYRCTPCPIQTSHILIDNNSQSKRNYEMRRDSVRANNGAHTEGRSGSDIFAA
ncbi:hypothetical protein L9F63_000842, partial [Diploptera punctata]